MHPDPLFTVFGRGIYPYGLCMALGVILCLVFLYYALRKRKFNGYTIDAIFVFTVIAFVIGIVFGMLFQAVYNYIDDPAAGFRFGSGITFIGGLIGGVASFLGMWNVYVYAVRPHTSLKFAKREMNAGLTDALPAIPISITIAHAFGRLGCFFAGCCYGLPTDAWCGLPCAAGRNGNFLPVQLFEMFFLLALSAVMAFLYFKYEFDYNFAVYCIAYGVWRFAIEFLRADERGRFIGALSPSQFWCIVMVLVGIGYVFLQKYVLSRHMKHPEKQGELEITLEPPTTALAQTETTPTEPIEVNYTDCDD